MATRLAWWTIPATVVVLVRVVTLDSAPVEPVHSSAVAAHVTGAIAVASGRDQVVLRDAAGRRSGPVALGGASTLVLQLPDEVGGHRIDFTLRRYLPHVAEPSLWLHGTPRIRPDGCMPILGLPLGRYALEVAWGEGDGRQCIARDVTVPGTIDCRR